MRRPGPTALFIYALGITVLAFAARNIYQGLVVGVPNAVVGIALGYRRARWVVALFFIGLIGIFIDALLFSNTGSPLLTTPIVVVRLGALESFAAVSLRLAAIMGGTLVFVSLVSPRELIDALESELRLPKEVAFSIAVGVRMLRVLERDAREVQFTRLQRGLRRYPVTPGDLRSFLHPLLSLGVERARWIGIAAELRGFALRRSMRRTPRVGLPEALAYAALATEAMLVALLS